MHQLASTHACSGEAPIACGRATLRHVHVSPEENTAPDELHHHRPLWAQQSWPQSQPSVPSSQGLGCLAYPWHTAHSQAAWSPFSSTQPQYYEASQPPKVFPLPTPRPQLFKQIHRQPQSFPSSCRICSDICHRWARRCLSSSSQCPPCTPAQAPPPQASCHALNSASVLLPESPDAVPYSCLDYSFTEKESRRVPPPDFFFTFTSSKLFQFWVSRNDLALNGLLPCVCFPSWVSASPEAESKILSFQNLCYIFP